MNDLRGYHSWNVIWTAWFFVTFGGFAALETYALCTDWQRTLSAAIWRMEDFLPGQPLGKWSAVHFLLIACLLVLFVWLLGHFGWGLWR